MWRAVYPDSAPEPRAPTLDPLLARLTGCDERSANKSPVLTELAFLALTVFDFFFAIRFHPKMGYDYESDADYAMARTDRVPIRMSGPLRAGAQASLVDPAARLIPTYCRLFMCWHFVLKVFNFLPPPKFFTHSIPNHLPRGDLVSRRFTVEITCVTGWLGEWP
jgi:hypothetical protein